VCKKISKLGELLEGRECVVFLEVKGSPDKPSVSIEQSRPMKIFCNGRTNRKPQLGVEYKTGERTITLVCPTVILPVVVAYALLC